MPDVTPAPPALLSRLHHDDQAWAFRAARASIMLPVLILIPVVVSFFHLVAELIGGEATGRRLVIQGAWFLAAVWLQFFGPSSALSVTGLVLQVLLAIYLRLRATLGSKP